VTTAAKAARFSFWLRASTSAAEAFPPALFAARVRIACPSFVDVDEVVLGSA
jgi:hypothetical protein